MHHMRREQSLAFICHRSHRTHGYTNQAVSPKTMIAPSVSSVRPLTLITVGEMFLHTTRPTYDTTKLNLAINSANDDDRFAVLTPTRLLAPRACAE